MSSFGELVPSFFWHRARIWQILVTLLNLVIILLQNYCDIIRPVKVRFWFCCFIGFDGSAALFPSFVCIRCLFSLNCLWLLKNAVKITMCFWLSRCCLFQSQAVEPLILPIEVWGIQRSSSLSIALISFLCVSRQELRGHLETCLMEGTTLVVTDVDVNELEFDSRFYFILRSRYRFLTSSTPFKLMVRSYEGMPAI